MNKYYIGIGLAVIVILGIFAFTFQTKPVINSFIDCEKAGYPVMESYPRQCNAQGRNFVEIIDTPVATTTGTGVKTDPKDDPIVKGILPYDSGVEGVVTLGPTCPVMRVGDTSCADRPYVTTVQIIRIGSPKSSPFATIQTDKYGKYKIMLPPGDYALQPVGGPVLPRCETREVTLVPAKIIKMDLSCDSGIR